MCSDFHTSALTCADLADPLRMWMHFEYIESCNRTAFLLTWAAVAYLGVDTPEVEGQSLHVYLTVSRTMSILLSAMPVE